MRISPFAAIAVLLVSTACSSGPTPGSDQPVQGETQECSSYRAARDAPISPDAMERLRDACRESRRR